MCHGAPSGGRTHGAPACPDAARCWLQVTPFPGPESNNNDWNYPGTLQFKGTAKVVGVRQKDHDSGENCVQSGFQMACVSSRGSGPWHHFVTEAGLPSQLGFASEQMNTITGNAWATEKYMKANTPIKLMSTTTLCKNGRWIVTNGMPTAREKDGGNDHVRFQRYLVTRKDCSQAWYGIHQRR